MTLLVAIPTHEEYEAALFELSALVLNPGNAAATERLASLAMVVQAYEADRLDRELIASTLA